MQVVSEGSLSELKLKLKNECDACGDIEFDDALLKRFLRAFADVDHAFNRYVKYQSWRRDFKVDMMSPLDEDIQSELCKKTVFVLNSRDYSGRPIVFVQVRNHNVQERVMDRLVKFMVYTIERACEKCSPDQDQLCVVFDLTGFTMNNMDYQFVRQLIYLFSAYYPERLGVCLVINAPYIFQGCWAMIKPWMSEVTVSKVVILNSQEQVAEYLNPDILPVD